MDMFFSYWIWIILFALLFIAFVNSGKNKQVNNSQEIDIEVPHPQKSHPIKFIQYLETTRLPSLGSVYFELDKQGLLSNPILKDAFKERLEKGSINGSRWRQKLSQEELKEFYDENIDNFEYITTFEIAGISFENRLDHILKECQVNDIVELVPEPNNIYDKNAIKIVAKGHSIGYVPKNKNLIVKKHMKKEYLLKISEIIKSDFSNVFVSLYAIR